jgi:hypothetical protein
MPTAMSKPLMAMKPVVLQPTFETEMQPAALRTVVQSDRRSPLETVKTWLGLTPQSRSEVKRESGWGEPFDDEDLPDLVVRPLDWDKELDGDWDKYLLKSKTLRWLKDADAMMMELIKRSAGVLVPRLGPAGCQEMVTPVGRLKTMRLPGLPTESAAVAESAAAAEPTTVIESAVTTESATVTESAVATESNSTNPYPRDRPFFSPPLCATIDAAFEGIPKFSQC